MRMIIRLLVLGLLGLQAVGCGSREVAIEVSGGGNSAKEQQIRDLQRQELDSYRAMAEQFKKGGTPQPPSGAEPPTPQ